MNNLNDMKDMKDKNESEIKGISIENGNNDDIANTKNINIIDTNDKIDEKDISSEIEIEFDNDTNITCAFQAAKKAENKLELETKKEFEQKTVNKIEPKKGMSKYKKWIKQLNKNESKKNSVKESKLNEICEILNSEIANSDINSLLNESLNNLDSNDIINQKIQPNKEEKVITPFLPPLPLLSTEVALSHSTSPTKIVTQEKIPINVTSVKSKEKSKSKSKNKHEHKKKIKSNKINKIKEIKNKHKKFFGREKNSDSDEDYNSKERKSHDLDEFNKKLLKSYKHKKKSKNKNKKPRIYDYDDDEDYDNYFGDNYNNESEEFDDDEDHLWKLYNNNEDSDEDDDPSYSFMGVTKPPYEEKDIGDIGSEENQQLNDNLRLADLNSNKNMLINNVNFDSNDNSILLSRKRNKTNNNNKCKFLENSLSISSISENPTPIKENINNLNKNIKRNRVLFKIQEDELNSNHKYNIIDIFYMNLINIIYMF